MMKPATQVVLVILDGWGLGPPSGNAIAQAATVNIERLGAVYPQTALAASGPAVGLPAGQMGNSEVGHLNIGAGRVVAQDLTRINRAIAAGSFFTNEALAAALDRVSGTNALHLLGLLSDGGVHSQLEHIEALLTMAKDRGVAQVFIHPLLDGRDTPPQSAEKYVAWLEATCAKIGLGTIATIGGRFYGMDRDQRWSRVEQAYQALAYGVGPRQDTAGQALAAAYAAGVTDEFLVPTVIDPNGVVKDGDSLIAFNFRPDRMRQITRAFVDEEFTGFPRQKRLAVHYLCLTQYDATIAAPVAYPPEVFTNTLGQVVSAQGLKQLRVAETEKYAHVTYFFNGGQEQPLAGETRRLIPSPQVETYDRQPEMSAKAVTAAVCQGIASREYALVVVNYANPDMVGHTGNLPATVAAVEAVDSCVGQVWAAVEQAGAALMLFSDHGNAESMVAPGGQPHTAHTLNPVPLLLAWPGVKTLDAGALCDIAPTVLDLLGIAQPREMTGKTLIVKE